MSDLAAVQERELKTCFVIDSTKNYLWEVFVFKSAPNVYLRLPSYLYRLGIALKIFSYRKSQPKKGAYYLPTAMKRITGNYGPFICKMLLSLLSDFLIDIPTYR